MAGLGAFLAAGAAAGIGNGLVAQAKLDFEAAKQKAALEARAKERAEDRDFQMRRDETNFNQSLKLKEVDDGYATKRLDRTESFQERQARERRDYEAAEKDKDRAERDKETFTDDQGRVQLRQGLGARVVRGEDGEPVKSKGKVEYDSAAQQRLRERDQQQAYLDGIKSGTDDYSVNIDKVVEGWRDRRVPLDSPDVQRKTRSLLREEALKQGLKGDAVEAHIAKRSAELGVGGMSSPSLQTSGGGAAPAATRSAQPIPTSTPKPGDVDGGWRFKGGNPADRSNWEKV